MMKQGVFHRLILLVILVIASYYNFIGTNESGYEDFGWLLFIVLTISLGIFVAIPEIKKMLEIQKIARIKKFDPLTLILLLIAVLCLFLADWKTLNSDTSDIDDLFYLALMVISTAFIQRKNYYVMTKKWIRFWGNDGVTDSMKINFKDILEIENEESIYTIKTASKVLKIDINKVFKVDREVFEIQLSKLKNEIQNHESN